MAPLQASCHHELDCDPLHPNDDVSFPVLCAWKKFCKRGLNRVTLNRYTFKERKRYTEERPLRGLVHKWLSECRGSRCRRTKPVCTIPWLWTASIQNQEKRASVVEAPLYGCFCVEASQGLFSALLSFLLMLSPCHDVTWFFRDVFSCVIHLVAYLQPIMSCGSGISIHLPGYFSAGESGGKP